MSNYYTLSSMYPSTFQQKTTHYKPVEEPKKSTRTNITDLNLEEQVYLKNTALNNSMVVPKRNHSTRVSPNIWGRALWFSLHFGALNYPLVPTEEMKNMQKQFINGLPIMIPCDICKNHALQFLIENNSDIEIAVQNPDNLFAFFVKFHNTVNARIGKRVVPLEEAKIFWTSNPTQIFSKENFRL